MFQSSRLPRPVVGRAVGCAPLGPECTRFSRVGEGRRGTLLKVRFSARIVGDRAAHKHLFASQLWIGQASSRPSSLVFEVGAAETRFLVLSRLKTSVKAPLIFVKQICT